MSRAVMSIGVIVATTWAALAGVTASSLQAQTQGRAVPPIASSLADLKAVAPIIDCAQLLTADLAAVVGVPVKILSAAAVTDGRPAPYCRVIGTIEPAIQFEVRPPLSSWTQRFLQTGCGGLCGTLNINVSRGEGCAPATNGEIALASTDMGHSGGGTAEPTWGVDRAPQLDCLLHGDAACDG